MGLGADQSSSLETYNIRIGGRRTTVRLEAELMDALKAVAQDECTTISEVCERAARLRSGGSLTSALRLYVLRHYRRLSADARQAPTFDPLSREIDGLHDFTLATEGPYFVSRRRLSIDDIGAGERGFSFLLATWRNARSPFGLPPFSTFDLGHVAAAGFARMVHIIDVSPESPNDFRVLRRAPATLIYRTPNNVPLSFLGNTLYARQLKVDYTAAKFEADPIYQAVSVRTDKAVLQYRRMIFPYTVRPGKVDRLVIGVSL